MKLTMKINEGKKVLVCLKTLSEKENMEIEKWSQSVICDTKSYFKMPLFAISSGDLCYDLSLMDTMEEPEQKDEALTPSSSGDFCYDPSLMDPPEEPEQKDEALTPSWKA